MRNYGTTNVVTYNNYLEKCICAFDLALIGDLPDSFPGRLRGLNLLFWAYIMAY